MFYNSKRKSNSKILNYKIFDFNAVLKFSYPLYFLIKNISNSKQKRNKKSAKNLKIEFMRSKKFFHQKINYSTYNYKIKFFKIHKFSCKIIL